MSEIEMAVEALKRCVDPEAYSKAMHEVTATLNSPKPVKQSADLIAKRLLRDIGVPTAIKGYRYAATAMVLIASNPEMADSITKVLYPSIAEIHQTTGPRVERAIRHGIEVAWDRGDLDVLQRYFGNTVSCSKGKPTNGEFLTRMAEVIRDETSE